MFIIEPILAILDLDKKMRIEADALDSITRRVLLVKYGDEK